MSPSQLAQARNILIMDSGAYSHAESEFPSSRPSF
jgi:hypothetical protein